ncbi:M48 family metallopeptidase [Amycolatopsis sp. NPDC059657]|uniref:M48 family metallopeptidase n=1 Tax=Amycolatopsis sp. NPDC059657 TaxID=3346899 RepID=UPI00366DD1D2
MTETKHYLDALAHLGLPGDWAITVDRRPRRRSIGIEIGPAGTVTVLVPPDVPVDRVAHFVAAERAWIARNRERAQQLAPDFAMKTLVDGETFDLLGKRYHLRLTADGQPAQVDAGTDGLLSVRRADPEVMREAIIALYCTHGLDWAREHGAKYRHLTGLRGLRYAVRDLGSRHWGIYQKAPHLVTLHWPLFGLSEQVTEYVLVHELAHATNPPGTPHGPAWRQRMHHLMPDWQHRKHLLYDLGRHTWMGACQPR